MSSRSEPKVRVTILLIGATGMGKSSFGNLYLQEHVFEESQSSNPVTLQAIIQSKEIQDIIRSVIDTEGFDDGNSIISVQIQNLAKVLKEYKYGINVIVIVLNGRYHRFAQGVKDLIRFVYDAFATKEILSHICVVFTNCDNPTNPDRNRKRTEYKECVRHFLSEISNEPIANVPEIPIYFVDCCADGNNAETNENMDRFHGWACTKQPLDTKFFKEANYHEKHEIEKKNKVYIRTETRGNITYDLYEDQERTKITPNNGDSPRYSNWKCLKKYEEAVKEVIIEKRNNFDLGYQYSKDNNIRYKATVNQERKIVRDPRTQENIECTGWYNVSEVKLTKAGQISERKETRDRKFEKKDVVHHGGHGAFGGSNHTHSSIFHKTHTEERTIRTDYDGNETYGNWYIVSGSEREYLISNFEEGGHQPGYSWRAI